MNQINVVGVDGIPPISNKLLRFVVFAISIYWMIVSGIGVIMSVLAMLSEDPIGHAAMTVLYAGLVYISYYFALQSFPS